MLYKNIDVNLNEKEIKYLINIQNQLLNIADKIHNICVKNNIEYSLFWGSMLGAIRHKGFIPWDDDLDIVMTVENYQKFKALINQSSNKELLIFDYKDKIWNKAINKVFLKKDDFNFKTSIFVDIFIVSEAPLSIKKVNKNFRKMAFYWNLSDRKFKFISNMFYKKIANNIENILFKKEVNHTHLYFPSDPYAFKKHQSKIFNREWFWKVKLVKFEDREYYVYNKYDEILINYFGDYKKLPPFKDRKGHHFFKK